jgi:hypothetical protein
MSQSAALLVLVSAFLHAAWNGVIKRDEDSRSAGGMPRILLKL